MAATDDGMAAADDGSGAFISIRRRAVKNDGGIVARFAISEWIWFRWSMVSWGLFNDQEDL